MRGAIKKKFYESIYGIRLKTILKPTNALGRFRIQNSSSGTPFSPNINNSRFFFYIFGGALGQNVDYAIFLLIWKEERIKITD